MGGEITWECLKNNFLPETSGPPLGGMTLAQADRQTATIENISFFKLGFAGSTFFFLFKLLCRIHTMLIV